LAGANCADRPENVRDNRQERWQLIVARENYDDPERQRVELLLRWDIPIHCQQDTEARLAGRGEQRTVLERRPPHLRDGLDLVTSQLTGETSREVFIE
jgi:hypothetical protein